MHFNIIPLLSLSHPRDVFPTGFPTEILYAPFLSPVRATRPAHLLKHTHVTIRRRSIISISHFGR